MSDFPSSSTDVPSTSIKTSNTPPPSPAKPSEPELIDLTDEPETQDENEICIRTLLKLLTDPYKLCHYLELTNGSEKAKHPKKEQVQPSEMTPPELVITLKRALSNPAVLSRAVRHFQTFVDDDLYKLMSVFQTNCRNLDTILNTFLSNTDCSSKDSLTKLVKFLSELLEETVPKRFRIDTMLATTIDQLDEIEKAAAEKRKLPEGKEADEVEYNEDDWVELLNRSRGGGQSRIFDNSNITLTEALKKMAEEYKGRSIVNNIKVAEQPDSHRMSDSKFHRAYTVADTPDYEKIYTFLSNMTGCRSVSHKEIERADATVVLNIFQEMEEVIATHFDTFARQMPMLREQLKDVDVLPPTGFKIEDVNDVEANVCQLPAAFKNMYHLEQQRRELLATRSERTPPVPEVTAPPEAPQDTVSNKLPKPSERKNCSFMNPHPPAKKAKKG